MRCAVGGERLGRWARGSCAAVVAAWCCACSSSEKPESKTVKELLEENNLDLILPSEAVVYVKPEMNLTSQLLEKLNR